MAAAANSKLPLSEAVAQSLAQDRPTIDAALKTYMSWVVARSLTTEASWSVTSQEALICARAILKSTNSYVFDVVPSKKDASEGEREVVAQIWNGLIASKQKPSRFVGRKALVHAWEGIRSEIVLPVEHQENGSQFVDEFGALMMAYDPSVARDEDSDAHLIWDEQGAELERRRQRRFQRAKEAKDDKRMATPVIEELPEGHNEEEEMLN